MIGDKESWLSGYRTLWMLVMFDLPVVDKEDRRAYAKFRNFLLDEGFQMAQFSIYYRLLSGKEAAEKYNRKIEKNLPEFGSVHILAITDKQYENMITFLGKRRESPEKQDQLLLF